MEGGFFVKKKSLTSLPPSCLLFFLSDFDSLSKKLTTTSKAHFQIAGVIDSGQDLISSRIYKVVYNM